MNKIITTSVLDPTIQQPLTARSLDFLQSATTEVLAAIVQNIIGSNTVSTTTPYSLYGCVKTSLGGGNYSFTQGYIYFNKEVYYFPAISSINISNTAICTITTTNDAIADPLLFTDGVYRNVHNHRTIVLTDGLTGSADFNFDSTINLINPKVRLWQNIADFSSFTGEPTYASLTTPNDGVTRNYMLEISLEVAQTAIDSTNADAGRADSKTRIYSGASVLAICELQSYSNDYFTGHFNKNICNSVSVRAIATLPPNTTIDFKVEDVRSNGGLVNVIGLATMFEL